MKEFHPMERRSRFQRVPLALALVGFAAACTEVSTDPAGPVIPADPPLNPQILSAAWTLDVAGGRIHVRPPTRGLDRLSQSVIADYFGLEPGHPELSILGGDVIELTASNLDFGVPRALPGVGSGFIRDVSWDVAVRNVISGIELVAPTFPAAPSGTTTPVIIPFNQVVTVTSGSIGCEVGATTSTTDCFVEAPSEGNVFVSDAGGINSSGAAFSNGYQGPPHNFFNDTPCEVTGTYYGHGNQSDCRPFKAIGQTIAGGATAAPVRINYTLDQTVNQFRVQILVAADIQDGVPDTQPPVISGVASNSPQRVGNSITLTGSATDDRTAAAQIQWAWDFDSGTGAGPFNDASGNPASFLCVAPGTVTLGAQATDGANNSSSTTVTVTCVANVAPTVAFIGAPYSTPVSTSVTVNAGASTDDVGIATYEFNFGSGFGAPQVSAQASFTCPATPQTVTVTVRVTDTPDGAQSTGSTTITCTPPANLFLVWTSAGAPVTGPVAAGTTVELQICTTVAATQAFQANLTVPGLGTVVSQSNTGVDLNSVTQGLGACANVGGTDVVDQFTGGAIGSPFNFQNFSIAASAGTGVVGIARITYTTPAAGSVTPSIAPTVWSLFSGSAPAPIVSAQTLVVN
jgi:hypothetical protein